MNSVLKLGDLLLLTIDEIERLEESLLNFPQTELPVTNIFSNGVYWREMFVPVNEPTGTLVIGHKHKTKHLNILLSGEMVALVNGKLEKLTAPLVFESEAGTKKIAIFTKPSKFVNVFSLSGLEHCGEDIKKLEDALCEKSAAFLSHESKKQIGGIQ